MPQSTSSPSSTEIQLGYIPPMTKGITDNREYVIPFVEMLEEQGVELVWPASFDFTKTFDVKSVKSHTEAGARRIVISNAESQTVNIGEQRDWIRRYQDEVLAKL